MKTLTRPWLIACLSALLAGGGGLAGEGASLVEIPIKLHRGRIIIPARVNDSQPLSFLLDTACSIPTLHPALVDELKLQASGQLRINGIAGEERASTYRGVRFDLGGTAYTPSRIASIPSERKESRRRDGVLGSGFFRRFVVEIDPKTRLMKLYAPTNFTYAGPGVIVPFRLREEIPVIKAVIARPDKSIIEGEFEVDTGCDSGLCLGDPFVKSHELLDPAQGRGDEKFGVGGSIQTRNGTVPILRLGSLEILEPQTDFFVGGSPVDEPLAGHLGMGVLHQFRMILDYSRQRIILER